MRRITGAAVAATTAALLATGLVAGTAQASTTSANTSARSTGTPTCHTSGLSVTLDDGGVPAGDRAGMNHMGTYLRIKNTGDSTCILRGYPGLGLETAGHKEATTHTEWGGTYYAQDPGKTNVHLQSGDSAWADLAWTHTGADAVDAKYLQVTPPASTTHRTLAFDEVVDNGTLSVTALSDSAPPLGH